MKAQVSFINLIIHSANMIENSLTAFFLLWAAELDQYVFQDSQFEDLSKDIFSKLGALGSVHISFLVPWGAL